MKVFSVLILVIVIGIFLSPFTLKQVLSQNKDVSGTEPPYRDNYYLKTAKTYFKQKDYEKAAGALELAILLEPNNAEAHALRKELKQFLEENTLPDAQNKANETKGKNPSHAHDKEKKLLLLMQDAYTALKEKRYEEAAEISDSILTIDPSYKEALYIKEQVNELKYKLTMDYLKVIQEQEKLRARENLKESSILYQDILRFPAKEQWQNILERELPKLDKIVKENKRKTELLQINPNPAKEQIPKVVEDALNTIISFEFLDTPLKDVIVFLREKTNINMIIDAEARDAQITLKLKDIPLRTALRYILPKGYEYVIEGDIIHVYRQKMELRVYDVRDILINLDDKEPLKFDITAAAASQFSMSGGGGAGEAKVKDTSGRVLDLIEMIVTTIEPSSWSPNVSVIGASASGAGGQRRINIPGQGEGSITARMGQPGDIVVVNSKYVHEQIETLLASLRSSQNLQVSIEARFITVTDEFLEDIGNKFSEFFSERASINTDGSGNLSDLVTEGGGLQLSYSIFNDAMLKGFLRAVQESKDSEVLTSPRITLSNTQRGNIAVIQTRNYVQSTSVSEGIVTPVIGTIPEGTTFDVRPIVSTDRKYIYLEVTPSVFQIESIESFTFSGVTTDITVGGTTGGTVAVPPEQTVQLPRLNVSQVSVTVCVPDKGTLMIGGLGSINKNTQTTGIPILSKIPVLKRLFSRDQKTSEKSNLIILLKPTIIIKEEHAPNVLKLSHTANSDNKRD